MASFFPDEESPREPTTAEQLAGKLGHALRSKHLLKASINTRGWSGEFEKLLTKDHENEIQRVLDWLIQRLNSSGCPKVYSASSFCRRYKELKSMAGVTASSVEISPQAKTIATELKDLEWPAGSDRDLESAIQICLTNYKNFRRRLRGVIARLKTDERRNDLDSKDGRRINRALSLAKYLEGNMPDAYDFVTHWMETTFSMIENWDGWQGNLHQHNIEFGSHRFERFGWQWAMDFCHNSRRWDELMAFFKET